MTHSAVDECDEKELVVHVPAKGENPGYCDVVCPNCNNDLDILIKTPYNGSAHCPTCGKIMWLDIWVEFSARTWEKR